MFGERAKRTGTTTGLPRLGAKPITVTTPLVLVLWLPQDAVSSRTTDGRSLRRQVLKGAVLVFITAGGSDSGRRWWWRVVLPRVACGIRFAAAGPGLSNRGCGGTFTWHQCVAAAVHRTPNVVQ